MKKKNSLFLFVILIISACNQKLDSVDGIGTPSIQPPALTSASTPSPILTPTISVPVQQNTPIPFQEEAINTANARTVQKLAEWGNGNVLALSLSENGENLLVASKMKAVEYRTDSLEILHEIFYESAEQVVISPGHSYIAIVNFSNFQVLDFETGDVLFTIPSYSPEYYGDDTIILFSPDESWLVFSYMGMLELWNMNTLAQQFTFPQIEGIQTNIQFSFSSDGRQLAISSREGQSYYDLDCFLRVWDLASFTLLYEVQDKLLDSTYIYGLAFSSDNSTLYSFTDKYYSGRGYVYQMIAWQADDGSYIDRYEMEDWAYLKQALPDGSLVTFDGNNVNVIDASEGTLLRAFPISASYSVYKDLFTFSADGSMFAVNTVEGIRLLNMDGSDSYTASVSGIPETTSIVAVSADAARYVITSAGEPANVIDAESGDTIFAIPEPHGNICTAAFSPDGNLVALGSMDSNIYLYNIPNGELIRQWQGHRTPACDLSFSPSGELVASASADKSIFVWNVANDQKLGQFASDAFHVGYLAFSPDSQILVASAGDGLTFWDTTTWEMIGNYRDEAADHFGRVFFSENGDFVVAQPFLNDDLAPTIYILDATTMEKQREVSIGTDTILLSIGTSSSVYLVDSSQGVVFSLDFLDGSIGKELALPLYQDGSLVLSSNHSILFGFDKNRLLFQVSLTSLSTAKYIQGYYASIDHIQVSPDDQTLAVLTDSGNLYLFDLSNGETKDVFSADLYGEHLLEISPDFENVITYKYDEIYDRYFVVKRDLNTGELIATVAQTSLQPMQVSYSPTGEYLMLTSASYNDQWQTNIYLFEHASNDQVFKLDYSGYPGGIQFSQDSGKALIQTQTTLRILKIPQGTSLGKIELDGDGFSEYGFNYDGTGISYQEYLYDEENFTYLENKYYFDIGSGEITLLPSTFPIGDYSPDGSLVLDGAGGLFDVSSQSLLTFLVHDSVYLHDWIFTRDGEKIITATENGTINVYGVYPFSTTVDTPEQTLNGNVFTTFFNTQFQPNLYNDFLSDTSQFEDMYSSHSVVESGLEIITGNGDTVVISNSQIEDNLVLFNILRNNGIIATIEITPGVLFMLYTPLPLQEEIIFWGVYDSQNNTFVDFTCPDINACYLPASIIPLEILPDWTPQIIDEQTDTIVNGVYEPLWCTTSIDSYGGMHYKLTDGEIYYWGPDYPCPSIWIDYP